MGSVVSLILCPITIPIKMLRSLLALVSFLWIGLLIAVIVLVIVYWKNISLVYNNVKYKIDDIKTIMDLSKSKIEELTAKIEELSAKIT